MTDEQLSTAYTSGQQAWPELKLDADDFAEHCRRIIEQNSGSDIERFASDLFLSAACMKGDPAAAAALEEHALAHMTKAVARISPDSDFIDETVQVLRHRLLVGEHPKIAEYSARGPLLAWLAVVATRAALDEMRSRQGRAAKRVELSEQFADSVLDPEVAYAKLRYAPMFQEALQTALKELSPRDRNILRMKLTGGCSIDQLGRAYRVDRATAARWFNRAKRNVLQSVRRQLTRDKSALSSREFASIANLVESQLDISLSTQFSREGGELSAIDAFVEMGMKRSNPHG